ncbi:MAG: outer membrane protein transport protein [Chitinispirillia bacterium]|nr:outer membrane protein transport protein [Chitinispirillia bacterium]
MKKRFSATCVSLVILSVWAAGFAQSPLGVHFPLGMPTNAVSGPSAAMAGSGTAVVDEYLGSTLNPANMAIGSRAAFSALVSRDKVEIRDNDGSSTASGYSPKLLSLILPLGGGSNISFAMQKQYDANLNFFTADTENIALTTHTNTIDLQNRGGLTSWQAGWGYRFNNRMSFGLIYEKLFFNSESRKNFESTLSYENGIRFRESYRDTEFSSFSSDGVRLGVQIPVHEKVMAGVSASYAFSSKSGSLTNEYQHSSDRYPHEESKEKFNVHLPPSVSAGISYHPNGKWIIALDWHSTIWDRYEHSISEKIPDDLRTTHSVALGTCFTPATNKLSAAYWETINYRAGLRYSQLPLEKSQEYLATIGTGLPIPNDGGLIDVIFGFGRRNSGKYSGLGYREYVTKFELGINGGRSWFQKPPARNY